MDPQVASQGSDHCVATWHDVLIQIWRTGTSLQAARVVRATARRLAAERPGALATLVVIERGADMPSAEARAELSAMAVDQQARMVAAALVHEGNGFRTATVRAVMTGMMLVSRSAFPHKIFATVEEGSRWLRAEPRLDGRQLEELPEALRRLRARVSGAV